MSRKMCKQKLFKKLGFATIFNIDTVRVIYQEKDDLLHCILKKNKK